MLSRIERLNRMFSCSTIPNWRRNQYAVHHGEIDAVDEHTSALGDVKALHKLGERTLSRAGWADNANNLARGNAETHVVQHLRPVDAIAKRNVLE